MRPTLRQIEYFVTVAELGSFRGAAERLHVTQPSLSKQIRALETDLGVQLFERSSRKVRLSKAGEALLPDGRAMLGQASAFREHARALARGPAFRLTAGVLPSIGAYFMPRFVGRLRRLFPGLQLSFVEGSSQDLLGRLAAGELDFVIASRGPEADFRIHPLFEETLWLCSTPDDPVMQPDTAASLDELRGRQLLTLSPDFHLSQIVARLAEAAGAELSADYRGPSLDAVRQLAASSPAVAVLPSLYALGEAIRDPAFKVRRLDHPDATHPVRLYWRRTAPDPQFYRDLAAAIIAEKQAIRAERAPQFQV